MPRGPWSSANCQPQVDVADRPNEGDRYTGTPTVELRAKRLVLNGLAYATQAYRGEVLEVRQEMTLEDAEDLARYLLRQVAVARSKHRVLVDA